jgi:hypothetical protein
MHPQTLPQTKIIKLKQTLLSSPAASALLFPATAQAFPSWFRLDGPALEGAAAAGAADGTATCGGRYIPLSADEVEARNGPNSTTARARLGVKKVRLGSGWVSCRRQ